MYYPPIFGYLCMSVILIFLSLCSLAKVNDKILVCYLASWSLHRKPVNFTLSDIDPFLCTHIIYGFVGLKNDTNDAIVSISTYTDLTTNYGMGAFSKVTALKKINPNLKVLVSIGGWNEGSINYSRLSQSPSKRRTFVSNAVKFLREHNFDGLDIYWQFPAKRGGLVEDKDNFPILLRELRDEFDKHNYKLTVFISCFKKIVDSSYDIPAIGQIVDWINLHCFNFYTPWVKEFGVTAPLKSNSELNIETTVEYYLTHGVSSNKIALAVPTHGYAYKDTDKKGMVEGLNGAYNDDKGFIAYHEVCQYLKDKIWTETWDETTLTPIATKETNKISYDNERSMRLKTQFAVDKHLKGIAVWSLDTDDFQGVCSESNTIKFPLIKAIKQTLGLNSSDVVDHANENTNTEVTFVIEDYS